MLHYRYRAEISTIAPYYIHIKKSYTIYTIIIIQQILVNKHGPLPKSTYNECKPKPVIHEPLPKDIYNEYKPKPVSQRYIIDIEVLCLTHYIQ